MFADTALVARIERAEAELVELAARAAHRRAPDGFVIPLSGAVAARAEPGSPFNKVAGLGFAGVPEPAALDAVERAFADVGEAVQVELSTVADPRVAEVIGERGYRMAGVENVLGLALDGRSDRVPDAGVEVRPAAATELEAWLAAVSEAAVHADDQGAPSHEEFSRDAVERAERDLIAAGSTPYLALRAGVVAGGATLRVAGDVAQLTGAATLPAHRGRGVHRTLLAARLADAAAAGCRVAVVTTQPASRSQQNLQRAGFELLYARVVLVKRF